jgi:hypothetical protein
VFWTPGGETLPSGSAQLIERYFSGLAADSGKATNVFGVGRQYTDTSGFADYRQTFSTSQVVVDTNPYPARDTANCSHVSSGYPTCLTDAQLQQELARVISSRGLPSGIGGSAPIYFVVTPPDVNICYSGGQCADTTFCAYHSDFIAGGSEVLYSAVPFFLSTSPGTPQYAKSCQDDGNSAIQAPNSNLADVEISYVSHEENETLTDPLGSGWFDSSGNEDGDRCAAIVVDADSFQPVLGGSSAAGPSGFGSLFDQSIADMPYYTQSEWSNGDGACEMRPSPGALTAAFTAPSIVRLGTSATFDPGATTASNPLSSATWSFGDGSAARFDAGAAARSVVSHLFAGAGAHMVSLTLVDDRGNASTARHLVTADAPPGAAFSSSPRRPLVRAAVTFDARASHTAAATVGIASYRWFFGDGTSATGPRLRHRYRRAGSYQVTLTVFDSLGLTGTTTRTVAIRPGIVKIRARRTRRGAELLVKVAGAGRVSFAGRTIRLKRAATARFAVRLTSLQRSALAHNRVVRLRVRVRFAARVGVVYVRRVKLKLRA